MLSLIGGICIKLETVKNRLVCEYAKKKLASCGSRFRCYGGKFTFKNISVGNNVYIGPNAVFMSALAKIYIGNDVMFGPNVTIITGDHRIDKVGEYMINVTEKEKKNDLDIVIEDDVWIGANALILKGVTIGTGSVIGGGAIVVRDVPPYTIYVGSPSQKIKERFSKEKIELHKKLLENKY